MQRRTILASVALVAAMPARAADFRAFERAKLSMAQAAEIAERAVGTGARAVEAEFEGSGDRPGRFEVKVVTLDRLFEVKVDAETGQVMDRDEEWLERFLRRITHRDLQAAPTTLAQAVAAAEQRAGGRAIAAELKRDDGRTVWEIEVGAGGKIREVKVNAMDAAVLSVKDDD